MQTSQSPYADMHVKGGLLRARFLFVLMNHGPEMWSRILAALPEEDRAAFKEISVDNWYPLAALDAIDRAIAAELGGDSEEVYKQLGEFSATSSLSGPFSSLVSQDVHSFLQQSAMLHRAYQDFGSPAYELLSDTSGLLTIHYDKAPPVSFCESGTAYFRHAIELCGARAARITHTRCTARGDTVCEFYATWQP